MATQRVSRNDRFPITRDQLMLRLPLALPGAHSTDVDVATPAQRLVSHANEQCAKQHSTRNKQEQHPLPSHTLLSLTVPT